VRTSSTVLETIGNTPLVELRRVVPPGCARIVAKVEGVNPTGSMKDRIAQAMIERAEGDGRLAPGYTVVEYTGGSTGASLALICAVKGYPLRIVTSNAFSQEKLTQMRAYGAELVLVDAPDGKITRQLIIEMIATARALSEQPRTYWVDQLRNTDSVYGYIPMGEEIWEQTGGRVDAFVHAFGATHSLRGVAGVLRSNNPDLWVAAVEPAESAVMSGGAPGAHRIEGIGIGYTPPCWDPTVASEIIPVASDEAEAMARRLAREEGLFAGTSSGANVIAAIRVGQRLGPERCVATILVDSGLKYLSTGVFQKG
jgi:cysteine synthase